MIKLTFTYSTDNLFVIIFTIIIISVHMIIAQWLMLIIRGLSPYFSIIRIPGMYAIIIIINISIIIWRNFGRSLK